MKLKVELHEPPQTEVHEVSEDAAHFTPEDCKAARRRELQDRGNFPMYLRRRYHLFTKLISASEGWQISTLDTDAYSREVRSYYGITAAALGYISGEAKIIPEAEYQQARAIHRLTEEKYK